MFISICGSSLITSAPFGAPFGFLGRAFGFSLSVYFSSFGLDDMQAPIFQLLLIKNYIFRSL
jgi:hypothetical protein